MASAMWKITEFLEHLEKTEPANFEAKLERNNLIENFRMLDEAEHRLTHKEDNTPLNITMKSGIVYEKFLVVKLEPDTGCVVIAKAYTIDSYAPLAVSINVIRIESVHYAR